MILQDTAQVNTVCKQTSSYTQSVFPGRYFPLGLALVQQCNAFLGLIKTPACSIYGHLENLTLPIKSAQLNTCFPQPKAAATSPLEESSLLLDKATRPVEHGSEMSSV